RVRIVEEQHLCGKRLQRRGLDGDGLDAGSEEDTARLLDGAEEVVQRVHGERGEEAVRLRGRRAADDRDRRTEFRELTRKTFEPLRGDARQLLDARRRVLGEPVRPALDCGSRATA